ncbi:MAG: amidohydrolase family protein [Oscillospiraceae bacterium]|jgi:predicted TIM-barrel fold metal-dependent hydrolase|nr:amidohydrolase family protein [Oscillospiraceae bacterium]
MPSTPKPYIIDAHTHIYPAKIAAKATAAVHAFYDLPMSYVGSVDILLEEGRAAGISRFVVCSVATTPAQIAAVNRFLSAECAAHPEFIGLGALHPASDNPQADIDDAVTRGFRGFKLHPDFQEFEADSPAMLEVYRRIAATGLPLLIHAGDPRKPYSSPNRMANICKAVPDLTLIAAHFGGWREWHRTLDWLGEYPNCVVDTSSSLTEIEPETAAALVNGFGADRVLFATDFPMWDAAEELQRLRALHLPEDTLKKLYHANAERIFRI